jgi:hypothetical protein
VHEEKQYGYNDEQNADNKPNFCDVRGSFGEKRYDDGKDYERDRDELKSFHHNTNAFHLLLLVERLGQLHFRRLKLQMFGLPVLLLLCQR